MGNKSTIKRAIEDVERNQSQNFEIKELKGKWDKFRFGKYEDNVLILAVKNNNLEAVRFLLELDVNNLLLNQKNKVGATPLSVALQQANEEDTEILSLLVQLGAISLPSSSLCIALNPDTKDMDLIASTIAILQRSRFQSLPMKVSETVITFYPHAVPGLLERNVDVTMVTRRNGIIGLNEFKRNLQRLNFSERVRLCRIYVLASNNKDILMFIYQEMLKYVENFRVEKDLEHSGDIRSNESNECKMANEVIDLARRAGIKPKHYKNERLELFQITRNYVRFSMNTNVLYAVSELRLPKYLKELLLLKQ